jgi:regulator of RNase E activity RraB
MSEEIKIVLDEWNAYTADRDGVLMFISFDENAASQDEIEGLGLCARVLVPIKDPNSAGGPESPETEVLWEMEDELIELLDEHQVKCRLVGRLTYDGMREIVFQLHDWETFRPPVGLWMMQHGDYKIDVSEHEGWGFFDDYIRPRLEDQLFMADYSVIESLIESGSDPEKEHLLEYVFMGEASGLKRVAQSLRQRGYSDVGELDFGSGQIVLAKSIVLDPMLIVQESLTNYELAEDAGVEFDGWGAEVVE